MPMNLTIEVRGKPEKFHELYQTFQALIPTMRKETGCRDAHIYRDVEDGTAFFLSMDWEGPVKLEQYLRSSSGSALLGAVDLLSGAVRVRIGNDSPWEEVEVLKQMRKDA